MIPKLISQSRTTEVDTASDNLLAAYKKGSWDNDAYLVTIFTELETESNQLTTAINRSKAESNLDKKDVARDENVKALNYLLVGSIHHPDTAIKTAAENLFVVFSKYGLKMTQASYSTESALIDSLLEDLAANKLQADIAAVSGCAEIIAKLQATQNDFKSTYFAWEEKKAQEGLTQCATDIKRKVLSTVNEKIVVYLNGMKQANEALYGELSQTVSQIISDNNEAVKKRRKKEEVEPELSIDE